MTHYTVKDLMVPNPEVISPEHTLKEAAEAMARIDCGIMPVGTRDNLIGMITDRDIVIRAVAKGRDPSKTRIRDIMTNHVFYIKEGNSLDEAAKVIKKEKVNRLLVRNEAGKLTGILSLSGLIRETADTQAVLQLVQHIAEKHKQAA